MADVHYGVRYMWGGENGRRRFGDDAVSVMFFGSEHIYIKEFLCDRLIL